MSHHEVALLLEELLPVALLLRDLALLDAGVASGCGI
jgi:hypothetical protein